MPCLIKDYLTIDQNPLFLSEKQEDKNISTGLKKNLTSLNEEMNCSADTPTTVFKTLLPSKRFGFFDLTISHTIEFTKHFQST